MRRLQQLRTLEVTLAKAGLGPVAGVDEAGRGACAGPITIAACILPERIIPELKGLGDSKKLTPRQREKLFPVIKDVCLAYSIVHIDAFDIDKQGIQHANVSGMRRAVARLRMPPRYVLTDALKVPGFSAPSLPVIGGDAHVRCIAAASILAKVARDNVLRELDIQFPGYELSEHKGYGTAAHQAAIMRLGASDIHRLSYSNVARAQKRFEQTKVKRTHSTKEQLGER